MSDTEFWLKVSLTFMILGIVVAVVYHQWTDCLGENSVLTCARMLN